MTATQLKIAPTGMRLHEWIALERGYFQAHGIEPIVRWDIVSGIMSSWQGKGYKERPQDLPFVGAAEPVDVINHCAWGSVCNAGAGLGKFVPDAYSVARWAFKDREWDFARFDVGERFHYVPLPRAEFDELLLAATRWGLDDHMQTRAFEELAFSLVPSS
jgi:hypothetical protein